MNPTRDRPISFTSAEVIAYQAGRKTQARLPVRLPTRALRAGEIVGSVRRDGYSRILVDGRPRDVKERLPCPFGIPGDQLWVRETWQPWFDGEFDIGITFAADGHQRYHLRADHPGWTLPEAAKREKWVHPGCMPRWAARYVIPVERVEVQRLHELTEQDALAEGCTPSEAAIVLRQAADGTVKSEPALSGTGLGAFVTAWDARHHARTPWSSNPWVWVAHFPPFGGRHG